MKVEISDRQKPYAENKMHNVTPHEAILCCRKCKFALRQGQPVYKAVDLPAGTAPYWQLAHIACPRKRVVKS